MRASQLLSLGTTLLVTNTALAVDPPRPAKPAPSRFTHASSRDQGNARYGGRVRTFTAGQHLGATGSLSASLSADGRVGGVELPRAFTVQRRVDFDLAGAGAGDGGGAGGGAEGRATTTVELNGRRYTLEGVSAFSRSERVLELPEPFVVRSAEDPPQERALDMAHEVVVSVLVRGATSLRVQPDLGARWTAFELDVTGAVGGDLVENGWIQWSAARGNAYLPLQVVAPLEAAFGPGGLSCEALLELTTHVKVEVSHYAPPRPALKGTLQGTPAPERRTELLVRRTLVAPTPPVAASASDRNGLGNDPQPVDAR